MKATELIAELEKLVKAYGDREVFCGGEDYPGVVAGISVQKRESAYVRKGAFKLHASDAW